MNKFRSVIRQVIKGDLIEIVNQSPTSHDFSLCIQSYQSLSHNNKEKFHTNLVKKLERENGSFQNLNLLILCDFLCAINEKILGPFPEKLENCYLQKSKALAKNKEEKLRLAENTFIYFYLQYLKITLWESKKAEKFNINDLPSSLTYCESALAALKLVIQYDFVLDYVFLHSEWKSQAKIAIERILKKSQEDLSILIKFIGRWNHIIVEDQNLSVHVNDIYEQLIFVSRNVVKLERISSKLKSNLIFPKYEINKKLNVTIEQSMLGKENERRELYSQKKLKTLGDIENEECEITECEIKVKVPF